jgi:hypothetical protein
MTPGLRASQKLAQNNGSAGAAAKAAIAQSVFIVALSAAGTTFMSLSPSKLVPTRFNNQRTNSLCLS